MRIKYFHIIFLFIATIILVNCSFHARGVLADGNAGNFDSLVGTKFYIQSNGYYSLTNELRHNLIAYKAIVIKNEELADYIINIQQVNKSSQLTSIVGGASNNTYQLIYTITYNLVRPKIKTPVIHNTTINSQMFWQSNSGTQLAQNNESTRIYNYLQSNLVTRMILQIAELLPSKNISSRDNSMQ
ncbi:hypothetical protein ACH24_02050 [Francisella persica ATCC VR-331]|uniref:LPS-assembly lipoprotein LptE n=1 Tax=Francisella persica ATCC VR-331 TaxID=1086726 RepID=A0A0K2JRP7_9GAMM|nr:LPS assembly lipoprotein LptE [Francisella persica]ALB01546.1 hypothetical protein ACH24_02050 [Francisella persica ATCC VR-331]ANH77838.1 hypothetical protein FSC845_04850 [Francisella persica ATCC VR-331]ANH77843.1 hypothetical protein FSC845_04880 [Francisella persica ATCC VR-331]